MGTPEAEHMGSQSNITGLSMVNVLPPKSATHALRPDARNLFSVFNRNDSHTAWGKEMCRLSEQWMPEKLAY